MDNLTTDSTGIYGKCESLQQVHDTMLIRIRDELTTIYFDNIKQHLRGPLGASVSEENDKLTLLNRLVEKGIITLGNYDALKKLFKNAECPRLCDTIEEAEKCIQRLEMRPRKKRKKDMQGEAEEENEVKVKPCTPDFYAKYSNNTNEVYENTSNPRGRALIINNKHFNYEKLSEREGTEMDVDKMDALLHQLNYWVTVHHDLTAKGIMDLLQDESARPVHFKYDSFILVIMSHGQVGAVIGTDGYVVPYENILEIFNNANCPALRSKPKMVFIQACQGKNEDCGAKQEPLSEPTRKLPEVQSTSVVHEATGGQDETVPTMADFLVAKATTPNFVSWRSPEKGTWFIQAIVDVFSKHACEEDVLSLLSKANEQVAKLKTSSGKKQVLQVESTLLKKVFFFPGIKCKKPTL